MQIETTRFGAIEVSEDRVLEFPEGLVGFPALKRFLVIDDESSAPFRWLQSLDEADLAYVAVEPKWVMPGYQVDLPPSVAAGLGIAQPGDLSILVIVTIPEDPREMTVNLRGPLVFNTSSRKGAQLVLDEDSLSPQHRIISGEASPSL